MRSTREKKNNKYSFFTVKISLKKLLVWSDTYSVFMFGSSFIRRWSTSMALGANATPPPYQSKVFFS